MLEFKSWILLVEGADEEVESIKQRTNPYFDELIGVKYDWVGEAIRQARLLGYKGGDTLPVVNGALAKLAKRHQAIQWGSQPVRVFRRAIQFDIYHVGEEEFFTRRPKKSIPFSTYDRGNNRDYAHDRQGPDADMVFQSYKEAIIKELLRRREAAKLQGRKGKKSQRYDLAIKIAQMQLEDPTNRISLNQLIDMFPDVGKTLLYYATLDIQDAARAVVPDLANY